MASVYYLLLFIVIASCQEATPPSPDYPPGDVRICKMRPSTTDQTYEMEVLPGIGFDTLRDLDMGQVHVRNFSTCSTSRDGKYLLPDNIFMIPVQQSKVDMFAEYFDHWDNYTTMTSNSMNVHAGFSFANIGAKFSAGYSSIKSHMYSSRSQSKSTRVTNSIPSRSNQELNFTLISNHAYSILQQTFRTITLSMLTIWLN